MTPGDDEHDNNLERDGSDSNSLRIKISELGQKLRDEREKSELLQFEACQDVERHARDSLGLKLSLARLEQDCIVLRERDLRDRDRIKGLYEEIERKERVFKDKFVELKDEIRDLECANVRAQNEAREWKMKYLELREIGENLKEVENAKGKEFRQLESRALKLVEESYDLLVNAKEKEHAVKVNEEMPKRTDVEYSVLTPEFKRKRFFKGVFDSETECDKEDRIPIGQLIRNNGSVKVTATPKGDNAALVNQSAGCNDIGDKMKPPRKKLLPRQVLSRERDAAAEEISDEGLNAWIPVSRANKQQKNGRRISKLKNYSKALKRSRSQLKTNSESRSKKKLKMVDLTCSTAVAVAGIRSYPRRGSEYQKGRKCQQTKEQLRALDSAEKVRNNLNSCHPSFIKSMIHSHVSGGFWLGLQTKFCKDYLPRGTQQMILEDENGSEYHTTYIGERVCLSGGWRRFALSHNLVVGDALVFELVEPSRFKVGISTHWRRRLDCDEGGE